MVLAAPSTLAITFNGSGSGRGSQTRHTGTGGVGGYEGIVN